MLDNSFGALIVNGDVEQIMTRRDFFERLTEFFLRPTKEKLDDLFESTSTPSIIITDKEKPSTSLSKSKPLIKHTTAVSILSVATGLLTYFAILPLAKDGPLQAIETSIIAVGVVSAIYFGLIILLPKKE